MSSRIDESLQVIHAPCWSHQTVLDGQPIAAVARAFVRHHLTAHRMFHLVDLVSVVTVKLTSNDTFVRSDQVLTLSLSQTDAVVLLRLDETSIEAHPEAAWGPAVDESIGTGVFGLLTLQWGVRRIANEATGLWATFDAHRHKQHAVATLEDSMASTQDRLPWHDGGEDGY